MLRQRQPRIENAAFLAFVREHRCCACGRESHSQAAHIRMASIEYGKRETGLGEKPDDRWSVPLCVRCHLDDKHAQHHVGERKFWARLDINPFIVARNLYRRFQKRRETRQTSYPRSQAVSRKPHSRSSALPVPGQKLEVRERKWPPKGARKIATRKFRNPQALRGLE